MERHGESHLASSTDRNTDPSRCECCRASSSSSSSSPLHELRSDDRRTRIFTHPNFVDISSYLRRVPVIQTSRADTSTSSSYRRCLSDGVIFSEQFSYEDSTGGSRSMSPTFQPSSQSRRFVPLSYRSLSPSDQSLLRAYSSHNIRDREILSEGLRQPKPYDENEQLKILYSEKRTGENSDMKDVSSLGYLISDHHPRDLHATSRILHPPPPYMQHEELSGKSGRKICILKSDLHVRTV